MKNAKRSNRWSRCTLTGICASAAGLASLVSPLMGEVVDSEIVLLVDVSGSIDSERFNLQRDAYAHAFRSADVLSAIQDGCREGVAVTMVYWAGNGQQHTAVDWMKIDSQASAMQFADSIQATSAPFSGRTALGEAMTHAVGLFGDETGGTANGFESQFQIINVSSNGVDNATLPRRRNRELNVEAARDGAMNSGVDMINGLPVASDSAGLDTYYENHVIAGTVQDSDADVFPVKRRGDLNEMVEAQVLHTLEAAECAHPVPEPSSTFLLSCSAGLLVFRRNRKTQP